MNKKIIIGFIAIMLMVTIFYVLVSSGVITLETVGSDETSKKEVMTVNDLEDGCYYVWHNTNSDIKTDLNGEVGKDVFKICPKGTVNWLENTNISHTIWFTSSNDTEIPTLYPQDQLIYISKTTVPSGGIEWERYADYGYTIGVANLQEAASGHYRMLLDMEKGYAGYINFESDASALAAYTGVSELFLDKIGSVEVRDNLVSAGGTITGLEKNEKYLCEWYTGTYYQDYEMTADNHTFGILEKFTTYDYEFLHSRAIAITIPEWFKSGYYYVEGAGLFRYVSRSDEGTYNGLAYDANINWNAPIILHDERGMLIYDPSVGVDKRNEQKTAADETKTDAGAEVYEDFY